MNRSIKARIKYAEAIKTRPAMAWVIVCLAPAAAFGSPPEVMYLKPPIIIIIKSTIPAKPRIELSRLANKPSKPTIGTAPLSGQGTA